MAEFIITLVYVGGVIAYIEAKRPFLAAVFWPALLSVALVSGFLSSRDREANHD